MRPHFDLLIVTPDLDADRIARSAAAIVPRLPPHRVALQLRSKQLAPSVRRDLGTALRTLTRRLAIPLFVNESVALARDLDADGVHLPASAPAIASLPRADVAGRRYARSTHTLREAVAAIADGAEFVTLGPLGDVPLKPPLERTCFAAACATLPGRVFALGGIADLAIAGRAVEDGAAGLAVMRSVLGADDGLERALSYLRVLDTPRSEGR